ncbi:hypothetical protein EJ02DRAFT_425741 [Clathrospora elynae]|uniref:Uncharacterized protein n=1 Tax=Clathrospora elynae TaxID=706981 RepID=A0A6A5SG55_9PLEO|nr:hypothetical protein EJ02DRAFT_425741 [Clathrospora elynae]
MEPLIFFSLALMNLSMIAYLLQFAPWLPFLSPILRPATQKRRQPPHNTPPPPPPYENLVKELNALYALEITPDKDGNVALTLAQYAKSQVLFF